MEKSQGGHTSRASHCGFLTRWPLDFVNVRYRPRRVDSASLKLPMRLMSLYERPRRLQSIKKEFRLLGEREVNAGAGAVFVVIVVATFVVFVVV